LPNEKGVKGGGRGTNKQDDQKMGGPLIFRRVGGARGGVGGNWKPFYAEKPFEGERFFQKIPFRDDKWGGTNVNSQHERKGGLRKAKGGDGGCVGGSLRYARN